MGYSLLVFAALCSVTFGQICNFTISDQDIDWTKVQYGPWKWAAYTDDEFTQPLLCSSVTIESEEDRCLLNMRYGQLSHQIYTVEGEHLDGGEYILRDFTESWRRIVKYTIQQPQQGKILRSERDTPMKDHATFYTDYKNYFIGVMCMPSGRVSVSAFTRHRRVTPMLYNRIRDVLEQNNIDQFVTRVNCKIIQKQKNRPSLKAK